MRRVGRGDLAKYDPQTIPASFPRPSTPHGSVRANRQSGPQQEGVPTRLLRDPSCGEGDRIGGAVRLGPR